MNVILVVLLVLVGLLAVAGLIVGAAGFYVVKQQSRVILERWGEFYAVVKPGLHWALPIMYTIRVTIDLRVREDKVKVEFKTKDNVFATIQLSLQSSVNDDDQKVQDAAYKLTDRKQLESYLANAIRAFVATLDLDELFSKQTEIADNVKTNIGKILKDYGYDLVATLVTDIEPDAAVKKSMNHINAAQRERVAAEQEGEAVKIKMTKEAEGKAAAMKLHGEGVANERRAIASGLHDARKALKDGSTDLTDNDVMFQLALTQYLHTMEQIGKSGSSKVILFPSTPAGLTDFMQQLKQSVVVGNEMSNTPTPHVAEATEKAA